MGDLKIAVNRMTGKVCDERIAKMAHQQRRPIGNLANPNLLFDYTNREIGTLPDDNRAHFQWVSEVAYKNIHRIVTRGYDTTELVEAGYGVMDVLFIDFQARIPLVEERKVLDYCCLVGLEDGLSNPALIARIVARGKSYLTQAAGASVFAFGEAYGAFKSFGYMLEKYFNKIAEEGLSMADAAALCVKECYHEAHFGINEFYVKDPTPKHLLDYAKKTLAGKRELKYIPFLEAVVKAAQAEIEAMETEAGAGGGAVTVKVNGKHEMVSIVINPDVLDDAEMLQDLIIAATNEAMRQVEEMSQAKMNSVTGGFGF